MEKTIIICITAFLSVCVLSIAIIISASMDRYVPVSDYRFLDKFSGIHYYYSGKNTAHLKYLE